MKLGVHYRYMDTQMLTIRGITKGDEINEREESRSQKRKGEDKECLRELETSYSYR